MIVRRVTTLGNQSFSNSREDGALEGLR